jgi:hypothetical protein
VVSNEGKGGGRIPSGVTEETNESEPLMTCRKSWNGVETGGVSSSRDGGQGKPVYCLAGTRHGGGVNSDQALSRNVGTCGTDAKEEIQEGSPLEGESTNADRRGGASRSRVEGPVMGLDQRGCIVRPCPGVNRQREERHG